RISDEIAERDRTIVEPIQTTVRIAQHAKLDTENRLVAPASSERLANQHLIVARPVEVTSIQQIDSSVERSLNRRDALSTILQAWLAVAVGHPHASETDRGHSWSGCAQLTISHRSTPSTAP